MSRIPMVSSKIPAVPSIPAERGQKENKPMSKATVKNDALKGQTSGSNLSGFKRPSDERVSLRNKVLNSLTTSL